MSERIPRKKSWTSSWSNPQLQLLGGIFRRKFVFEVISDWQLNNRTGVYPNVPYRNLDEFQTFFKFFIEFLRIFLLQLYQGFECWNLIWVSPKKKILKKLLRDRGLPQKLLLEFFQFLLRFTWDFSESFYGIQLGIPSEIFFLIFLLAFPQKAHLELRIKNCKADKTSK